MSSSLHWLGLDVALVGIAPFFLIYAPLASRSSPEESEEPELSRWAEPHLSPDLGVESGCWLGVYENGEAPLKPPRPLPEGVGKSEPNLRSPESWPNEPWLSSLSEEDKASLKVLENNASVTGGGGNIIAQLLGNISTMACTMPTKPHQSECFAWSGWMHSLPIILQMLIWNWKVVLSAFAIRGPWALTGTSFQRVSFILLMKASRALLA